MTAPLTDAELRGLRELLHRVAAAKAAWYASRATLGPDYCAYDRASVRLGAVAEEALLRLLDEVERLTARAERAEAERDVLRADAERYRWLREEFAVSAAPRVWTSNESAEPVRCLTGAELDAGIDTARAAGKE